MAKGNKFSRAQKRVLGQMWGTCRVMYESANGSHYDLCKHTVHFHTVNSLEARGLLKRLNVSGLITYVLTNEGRAIGKQLWEEGKGRDGKDVDC